jgi:hypothetical protein
VENEEKENMRIAILSANLGHFDPDVPNVKQDLSSDVEVTYHQYTDKDFPPIAGLTPRMQYRIPKMFGWEMFPGYDLYLWIDGSLHIKNPDTITWYLKMIENTEIVLFKHPHRHTVDEEVRYIDWKLDIRNMYIARRYQNGLHKENLEMMKKDPKFVDNTLYASTVFMYRNIPRVQEMMKTWWYLQSRYWSCDQVSLPYALFKHEISVYRINAHVFKNDYFMVGGRHAS